MTFFIIQIHSNAVACTSSINIKERICHLMSSAALTRCRCPGRRDVSTDSRNISLTFHDVYWTDAAQSAVSGSSFQLAVGVCWRFLIARWLIVRDSLGSRSNVGNIRYKKIWLEEIFRVYFLIHVGSQKYVHIYFKYLYVSY